MFEQRKINRVNYESKCVIVVCETLEKIYGDVLNISPLGIAVRIPKDAPSFIGKDVIIVAETVIMYLEPLREDINEDGSRTVAFQAKKFNNEVLSYLFEHIALDEDKLN